MVAEAYPVRRSTPAPSALDRARRDLRKLYRYRHLIRYLVSTSLRTENVNTYFGFVWWLLDPVFMTAIYTVLVKVFLRGAGIPHFPMYVIIGLLSFEFTSKAVRNAMAQTLLKERAMRQLAFPRSAIPIAATLGEAALFLIAIIVLVPFALVFGIHPTIWTLTILVILPVQLLLTLGLAFFFAAANMFFRDLGHLQTYVFRLWYFLSPCFFLPSAVPVSIRTIFDLNPFTTFFMSYRAAVMFGSAPAWNHLAGIAGFSIILIALGYMYFVNVSRKFARVE